MDCGPACLKMISDFHGRVVSLQKLREKCHIAREGVSLAGISESAGSLGLRTMAVKVTYDSHTDQPGVTEFLNFNQQCRKKSLKCREGDITQKSNHYMVAP